MGYQTKKYALLRARVEGLMQKPFTPAQVTRFDSNINLAANEAYQATRMWPRFLVIDQPRLIQRGIITSSLDAIHVYGSGTEDVDGLYERNGTANSAPKYTKYSSDGLLALFDMEFDDDTYWQILSGADNEDFTEDTILYAVESVADTPPETGWVADQGEDPGPLCVDVPDIDEMISISRSDEGYYGGSFHEKVHFDVDNRGYIPRSIGKGDRILYCTFKRPNIDTYGDGSNGTVSDIPEEWFNYIAFFCAYMFQVSERQENPNAGYGIALRAVEDSLEKELYKISSQQAANSVGTRIYTGTMGDSTLY